MRNAASMPCHLLVLTAAAGCGTWATATPLNPAPHPLVARTPESVEVFASAPPLRDHQDVALIKVEQANDIGDDLRGVMIRRLREHAAGMGCDAIFLGTFQELIPPDVFSSGSRTLSATCIVYRNPGDVVAAPPAAQRPRACVNRKDFDDHRNCILATDARR